MRKSKAKSAPRTKASATSTSPSSRRKPAARTSWCPPQLSRELQAAEEVWQRREEQRASILASTLVRLEALCLDLDEQIGACPLSLASVQAVSALVESLTDVYSVLYLLERSRLSPSASPVKSQPAPRSASPGDDDTRSGAEVRWEQEFGRGAK